MATYSGRVLGEKKIIKKNQATRKQSENSAELWQAHGFMTVAVSR